MLSISERRELAKAIGKKVNPRDPDVWVLFPGAHNTMWPFTPDEDWRFSGEVLAWINETVTPLDMAIAIGHGKKVWVQVYQVDEEECTGLELMGESALADPNAALREAIARCGLQVARWLKKQKEGENHARISPAVQGS